MFVEIADPLAARCGGCLDYEEKDAVSNLLLKSFFRLKLMGGCRRPAGDVEARNAVRVVELRMKALRIGPARMLLLLCVLLPIVLLGGRSAQAEESVTQHPFIPKKDIKSQTCLICHSAKEEGRYVHKAVVLGCQRCHQVLSEDQKTTITLVATGGPLCARCHIPEKVSVLHVPYAAGQCLVCHEPHKSDFPDLLRAQVNSLCLSCHGLGRPDIQVNSTTNVVTMLGDQQVSYQEYRLAPKIKLDPSGTSGHPVPSHPLTGPDPRKKDATLSCLSCHNPHGSSTTDLLVTGIKNDSELCVQCHQKST